MVEHQDGGPAYPGGQSVDLASLHGVQSISTPMGMSLRDYFAAKAMPHAMRTVHQLISLPGGPDALEEENPGKTAAETAAEAAYIQADAMLATRSEAAK